MEFVRGLNRNVTNKQDQRSIDPTPFSSSIEQRERETETEREREREI